MGLHFSSSLIDPLHPDKIVPFKCNKIALPKRQIPCVMAPNSITVVSTISIGQCPAGAALMAEKPSVRPLWRLGELRVFT
jgi:hypothetical protein